MFFGLFHNNFFVKNSLLALTYATSYMHGFSFSVHNSASIQLVASAVVVLNEYIAI